MNMTNKFFKRVLPTISMAFMITILLAGIINWVVEKKLNNFIAFIFQVFVYLIIAYMMANLIGRIDFKSYVSYFIAESLLIYPVTMAFGIGFRWFGLNVTNLIFCSFIYLCVMIELHLYIYHLEKINVDEINSLIEKGKKKKG